jgi:glycosyltransferase involved in cell wall biosynthesis
MNIVMVTAAPFPPREGMGYYVWNLARYLVGLSHQVQIITRGGLGRGTCEVVEGVTIWRPAFAPVYPFHVHLHSWFVNQIVSRLNPAPDLYHVHSPLVLPPHTQRPVIVTVHSPMLLAGQAIPLRNLTAVLIKLQVPVSVWIERACLAKATRVTTVAAHVAHALSDPRYSVFDAQVMSNGVDARLFCPSTIKPIRTEYVLTVGRLDVGKGLEDFIQCAQQVVAENPDIQFWIVGDGPLRQSLQRLAAHLGLSHRIRFLGQVSDRAELARLYQGARVFVLASHYEGLPTVMLEAMACGCAVVSSELDGAREVIESEMNGLLVPPRKPAALAAAILRILSDTGLGERLGHEARHTVADHYSWDKIGAAYVRLYEAELEESVPA